MNQKRTIINFIHKFLRDLHQIFFFIYGGIHFLLNEVMIKLFLNLAHVLFWVIRDASTTYLAKPMLIVSVLQLDRFYLRIKFISCSVFIIIFSPASKAYSSARAFSVGSGCWSRRGRLCDVTPGANWQLHLHLRWPRPYCTTSLQETHCQTWETKPALQWLSR